MTTHGNRLLSGVRELTRTEGTSLEDLHMVITDLVVSMTKLQEYTLKKLKAGQELRIYNEEACRDYGQKGSDLICFFSSTHETKAKGLMLRVYDSQEEWEISPDCLLEARQIFDPESEEGKKRTTKARPKKRGRKPKKASSKQKNFEINYDSLNSDKYEPEVEGEEYMTE